MWNGHTAQWDDKSRSAGDGGKNTTNTRGGSIASEADEGSENDEDDDEVSPSFASKGHHNSNNNNNHTSSSESDTDQDEGFQRPREGRSAPLPLHTSQSSFGGKAQSKRSYFSDENASDSPNEGQDEDEDREAKTCNNDQNHQDIEFCYPGEARVNRQRVSEVWVPRRFAIQPGWRGPNRNRYQQRGGAGSYLNSSQMSYGGQKDQKLLSKRSFNNPNNPNSPNSPNLMIHLHVMSPIYIIALCDNPLDLNVP